MACETDAELELEVTVAFNELRLPLELVGGLTGLDAGPHDV